MEFLHALKSTGRTAEPMRHGRGRPGPRRRPRRQWLHPAPAYGKAGTPVPGRRGARRREAGCS
ncbi:hypothetical protein, partial [Streptomyces sp. NPDC055699]